MLCVASITDSYLLFIRSADVAVQFYKASMVVSLFMKGPIHNCGCSFDIGFLI